MLSLGIASLACVGVGIILIGFGIYLSLDERKQKLKARGAVTAEGSAADTFEGLARLAEALRDYPTGMQMIFVGVALMLVGGGLGGVTAVANA
jgi:hypothetical protein